MIILPVGDENPRIRPAVVHWLIIAANVLIFVLMLTMPGDQQRAVVERFALVRNDFHGYQLVTSMFLHAGPAHLFFNMLFLYIVGDNVEDRLGHFGYLLFYLACGVIGAILFMLTMSSSQAGIPMLGASGAISGVMGAYLVFFPNARIRIFYLVFFFFNIAYVSAKWAIGLWFAQQVLLGLVSQNMGGGVAYAAHVGGFVTGLAVALVSRAFMQPVDTAGRILGAGGAPRRSPLGNDRSVWQPGVDEWGRRPDEAEPSEQAETVPEPEPQPVPNQARLSSTDLQREIAQAVATGKANRAYDLYNRLVSYGAMALPPEILYELGGLLVGRKEYSRAARVYEDYLHRYPESAEVPEAQFRLGIIYSRANRDYFGARAFLEAAAQNHPNPDRRRLAADEIRRVDSYLRGTFVGRTAPQGLCTIIRQTHEPINISRVAGLVATATRTPLADVSRQLRVSRGILAEHVPGALAERLAEMVQGLGVAVLVVPDEEMPVVEPAAEIRQVHLSAAGVKFVLGNGTEEVCTWDQVELLSVALAETTVSTAHRIHHTPRVYGGMAMGTMAFSVDDDQAKDEIVSTRQEGTMVADFFVKKQGLATHLRAKEGSVVYGLEGSTPKAARGPGFEQLVEAVMECAPSLMTNPAARALAAEKPFPVMKQFTFAELGDFDRYNRWLLTLTRHQPAGSVGVARLSGS